MCHWYADSHLGIGERKGADEICSLTLPFVFRSLVYQNLSVSKSLVHITIFNLSYNKLINTNLC